jgi:hypothetical protein
MRAMIMATEASRCFQPVPIPVTASTERATSRRAAAMLRSSSCRLRSSRRGSALELRLRQTTPLMLSTSRRITPRWLLRCPPTAAPDDRA